MTEGIFKKAKELTDEIKTLREKKGLLEEAQKLCWGNTSEVWSKIFNVCITSNNTRERKEVKISSSSAKQALDLEIKGIEERLAELQKEFSEL